VSNWITRSPRDATAAKLRYYRLQVRAEFVRRHGCVPSLARIDELLCQAWYRLPEEVADRAMMFKEMRRKQRARREEKALRSTQARLQPRPVAKDISLRVCVAPALI
jgi:hypothetical protein